MKREKKPAIRVNLADVDEELTQALGRELEGKQKDGSRSATGWNDPYRASGTKHSAALGDPVND
jgi:hypothetical protein